jgi:Zn finger protein HypA/HybF involved in hydrogenase expression
MSGQNIVKGGLNMQAYCVKCRAKKEMKDAKAITMKNGKPATQGMCPSCGTKMFRIGKG